MAETVAFFSYARQDEEATWGLLSSIHNELQNLVQLKTVDQISVFRDEERIELGDDWQNELESHLMQAHILVPILTPTYLSRPWCRRELEHFLDRGQREGRTTKILPLLLVKTQPNDAKERLINDRLAREIAKSQHADWVRHHLVRSERLPQDLVNDIGALAEKIASILDQVTKPTLPSSASEHPASVEHGTEPEIIPLPQHIDRDDQKEGFTCALQGADLPKGRNHALFISGPENECVMTCLDVLQRHTLKEGGDDVIVERCDVTWPARQRGNSFESAYCSTLASRLDGAVSPNPAPIGEALRALDKPLMIVSPIGRMDWQQAQVDNIETWLSIWHRIFLSEPELRAAPIIYTR
ncbi:MAG: toll/interleukin-1 receptor domain-containing protein, partial [Geminicoccaceae bacterium]